LVEQLVKAVKGKLNQELISVSLSSDKNDVWSISSWMGILNLARNSFEG